MPNPRHVNSASFCGDNGASSFVRHSAVSFIARTWDVLEPNANAQAAFRVCKVEDAAVSEGGTNKLPVVHVDDATFSRTTPEPISTMLTSPLRQDVGGEAS
jgi:hypothetical protein